MKPIVLSQSSIITLRAVERVLNVLLGFEVELRDCTMSAREWSNVKLEGNGRMRFVDLEGHFLFNGDSEYPQDVKALIQTRTYFKDETSTACLEWDASHEIWVNGTKYLVWFQSSKAFRVLELDGKGGVRECARSAEYEEAMQLPPGAKAFA